MANDGFSNAIPSRIPADVLRRASESDALQASIATRSTPYCPYPSVTPNGIVARMLNGKNHFAERGAAAGVSLLAHHPIDATASRLANANCTRPQGSERLWKNIPVIQVQGG